MRNLLISMITKPLDRLIIFPLIALCDWLDSHRKHKPQHRITFPDPKARERANGPIRYADTYTDTGTSPDLHQGELCPVCGGIEFRLTWFEGELMCLVCRDEALIAATGPEVARIFQPAP